jgi:alpha-ketoglutarate-dependent taurine dioxygenase
MPHDSPFSLDNDSAYQRWRERKLAAYPAQVDDLLVEIANPARLNEEERRAILDCCQRANMAVYRGPAGADKAAAIAALGEQFGLRRLDHHQCVDEDGISSLQVSSGGPTQEYIPYSDKPINWHTDGYYNTPRQQIHGLILHCVQQAASGGENDLLDHEIAYILLRDANPEYIRAFMQPDAMSIPPNLENGVEIRPRQTGPVFSLHQGALHMRYTARGRNIEWKDDPRVREAARFLADLLKQPSGFIFQYRLQPGEGLICNNVLHTRRGFANDPHHQRLLFRARYYDRII